MKNKIVVKDITMAFGDLKVLQGIDMELTPGIYGLIGPNGAGKSTLIRILSTLLVPTTGNIFFNNQDAFLIKDLYRVQIGMMSQSQRGYDDFKAIHFMYYMATLKGYTRKEATKEITRLIKQVGLEESMYKKIKYFSGGMKRRLLFAQSLLGNPNILILDEPTAGLDPYERIRMRNFIAKESKDKIVIIATHVMQDIESIAKEVILINKGSVICKDKPEEILKTVQGYVLERKIREEELEEYQDKYKISSVSKIDNDLYIRYITTEKTDTICIPTLEDAYLYYLT